MNHNSSLLSRFVQAALAILIAAYALHLAAELLLAVWPILLAGAIAVLVARLLWARWNSSDRW